MSLDTLLINPIALLSRQSESRAKELLGSLKSYYDDLKTFETKKGQNDRSSRTSSVSGALSSLLVEGFDVEQVWQQIELQNKHFRRNFASFSDGPSTSREPNAEFDNQDSDESNQSDAESVVESDEAEMDKDDEIEDEEEKSAFQRQQEKLHQRIEEYEEQILSEKPWQLGGEVTANKRPENSLLEEHVFYEHATKLPPVITQETTETLESLIIQRIGDQAWDDVERKIRPVSTPYVYKNELVLDQEKSKMSLSQLYEQEYLKTTAVTEEEKKNPKHEEVRKSMKELFFKLDTLSSCRYTPKPLMPELKVVNNMPSIRMEEVAPVSVSDATLLAPEEIKEKRKKEMKSKEERSGEDKRRELRTKKQKQRLRAAKKSKDDTGKTPRDKMKLLRKVGRIRRAPTDASFGRAASSKDFFKRLQTRMEDGAGDGKNARKQKGTSGKKKSGMVYKT